MIRSYDHKYLISHFNDLYFPTLYLVKIYTYRRGNVTRFILIRFQTICGDVNADYRKQERKGKKLPRNIKSFSTIEKVVTNFRDKEG